MKKNIKRNIRQNVKLQKRYNEYHTLLNEAKFNRCTSKITADIRKAKREFETKLAENIKEDQKSFYAYVRSKSRARVKVEPVKDTVGNLVSDDSEMANLFNEYFSSVFTKENLQNIPMTVGYLMRDNNAILENIDINQDRVVKALSMLKMNKAAGVDGLN